MTGLNHQQGLNYALSLRTSKNHQVWDNVKLDTKNCHQSISSSAEPWVERTETDHTDKTTVQALSALFIRRKSRLLARSTQTWTEQFLIPVPRPFILHTDASSPTKKKRTILSFPNGRRVSRQEHHSTATTKTNQNSVLAPPPMQLRNCMHSTYTKSNVPIPTITESNSDSGSVHRVQCRLTLHSRSHRVVEQAKTEINHGRQTPIHSKHQKNK